MEKICSKCETSKDIGEFHKNKRNKDGYKGWCKDCCRLYTQDPINKERKREYERNHRDERKPQRNIYLKRYRQTSKYKKLIERTKEKNKKY